MNAETTPELASPKRSLATVTAATIFFMVLLRIAIGWHFAYEGLYKIVEPDWRATGYLVQSSGPFRPTFRGMVKDVDGLQRLTPESVKQRLDERYQEMIAKFELTEAQQAKVKPQPEAVDAIFADPDFQHQLADYKLTLTEVESKEAELPGGTAYNVERLTYDYGKKSRALSSLLSRVEAPLRDLEAAVSRELSPQQFAKGPAPKDKSPTAFIDFANMWGLLLVGVCLMLGLCTPFAALGGVGLLCLYYFSNPPFPGYPESPMVEGHYLIVNKNMIEAIALLMIATSRVGRWAGLDAYLAPMFSRRR